MGSRNSVLTQKEKEECVELYISGESTVSLAKKYGVYPNSINGILRRRNVNIRKSSEAHRKYKINESFFDFIDSEEKAYILGLFYADGSNNIRRFKAYISLSEVDVDILYKIRSLISPDKPLLYSKRNDGNSNHKNRYMFYIDNKHISKQLENLGCVTNKTFKITFPNWIDNDLIHHFVRGYFDGDGHIGIYNNKARISVVSTESFCNKLKSIIENIGIKCSDLYCRFPERENSTRDFRITGNKNVLSFLIWIYRDATIYMERKYKKYQELISIME